MLPAKQVDRLTLAALGFLQGLAYWLAYRFWPGEPRARAGVVALLYFVTVAGLIVQFAWTGRNRLRLAVLSVALAALFAAVALWVWWQIPGQNAPFAGDDFRKWTWATGAAIALYILLPFIQIFQRSDRASFPYPELFQHSWNNVFIGLIAELFAGVFQLLIQLWTVLFTLIGVSLFADIFRTVPFSTLSYATVFGYGLAIGKENAHITNALRYITLAVFSVLMPLLAVIALLFLFTLPLTGLQSLWATKYASPLLLSLLGLTVLFINAVFQDGAGEVPYPTWVRRGVDTALLVMPIFCAITFFAIGLRINQYGLTPERFYVVLFAIIASVYALGYACATFPWGPTWLSLIGRLNVPLALFVALLAFLVHTPFADPLRWSAWHQFRRLADGKVNAAEFDYAALRFQLGRAGYAKLEELEKMATHPQASTIRQNIEAVRAAASYRDFKARFSLAFRGEDLILLGSLESVPPDLTDFLQKDLAQNWEGRCATKCKYAIFAINLDDDPVEEYAVIFSDPERLQRIFGYDRGADGAWQRIGMFQEMPARPMSPQDSLIEVLRHSQAEAVAAPYRDLKVGDRVFHLVR